MWRQRKKLAQVARLQASGQLSTQQDQAPDVNFNEALAAFGLQDDETEEDDDEGEVNFKQARCYLWPCNLATFNAWQGLQTQWRDGMGGRTGLDYASVTSYLRDICRASNKERVDMFKGLQAMEYAALDEWQKSKD